MSSGSWFIPTLIQLDSQKAKQSVFYLHPRSQKGPGGSASDDSTPGEVSSLSAVLSWEQPVRILAAQDETPDAQGRGTHSARPTHT